MHNLNGFLISLAQMRVVSGRPDVNAASIIAEIQATRSRGVDMIIFPEMSTTGYFIGDILEDCAFVDDVMHYNRKIIESTKDTGSVAIFGTIMKSEGKGEDGRPRLHNAAVIAYNGLLVRWTIKTLQPDYRFFNDAKHLYSLRTVAEEQAEVLRNSPRAQGIESVNTRDFLKPILVETRHGNIRLGVILCEDMWHEDYALNPAKILAEKRAEIIINLSASPWTWQKNQKRHRVVKELIKECHVPFVYVNNVGAQNTGKNILVFDGSSTVYNENGDVVYEVSPYAEGAHDFRFADNTASIAKESGGDTAELYAALRCATKNMLEMLPPSKRKIVIGVSGGIDSAASLAHVVDVAGKEHVIAVNMPFVYSNPRIQSFAETIARNLGVRYEVRPIGNIVSAICGQTGIKPDTLAYENVQARARMEILAAMAQEIGGVFPCNANKVEVAFGYGTMYGDLAGFYMPFGDLVKREVRQIADYMNRAVFERIVIPYECINETPTAELGKNQKDPFDYGDLNRRGYHDEMVRAFTEFRKNPKWLLEGYQRGTLESDLKLDSGTLIRLFPSAKDFVQDLTQKWRQFNGSFFKRIQSPPIPVVSKRAFGRDLEESLMPPYFTRAYQLSEQDFLDE